MTKNGDSGTVTPKKELTRIQEKNRAKIFAAALDEFSSHGLRGSTLEGVALRAEMSKSNLIYYFNSKETIFVELIEQLMEIWLEPLGKIDADGDPIEEILSYVHRKLEISRLRPRESRLFANEIIQGTPNITPLISGPLKSLVDEKAVVIKHWSETGRIAKLDPYDLIFSIWATTQHYADFAPQISLITPREKTERYAQAEIFLEALFRAALVNGPNK